MKKTLFTSLLITSLFLNFSCGETQKTEEKSKDKLTLEQIRYYKNHSKFRYFTFSLTTVRYNRKSFKPNNMKRVPI